MKTSESLWQYYRDESAAVIVNSESLKSKITMTGKNPAHDNKKNHWNRINLEIAVPLKNLAIFGELLNCLELIMKLISFKAVINLNYYQFKWSRKIFHKI